MSAGAGAAGSLMAAEMAEQPEVLERLVARREELCAAVRAAVGSEALHGIVIVARGSSDHAAVYGRYVLELAAGRPVALAAPSLVTRYGAATALGGWLAVGVSQSGRTPEVVTVLEAFRAAGARTVAITNHAASPLAAAAGACIDTGAGEERAVPATKTFTAQVGAFAVLAEALGDVPWSAANWDALAPALRALLADDAPARRAATAIGDAPGLVAVGRGIMLAAALEAALKLKETTALLAEGASAADFLHGPIAIVRRGLPILAISAGGPAAGDVAELAEAAREREGHVLTCSPDIGADLPLPARVPEGLAVIAAAVRAQQLARELALARGVDPDAPFGLSKVTATR